MAPEHARLQLLAFFVALTGVIFSARLFYVQIVQGAYFHNLADSQYRAGSNYAIYERGDIYFSLTDGQLITAAGLAAGYTLAINPSFVKNPQEIFKSLTNFIPNVSESEFLTKANKPDDPYEEIARRLSDDAKKKIEILKIPGVLLVKEQWRYYPAGSLAAQVLGFVGYNGNNLEGRYGLEKLFETTLTREIGDLYQNFFANLLTGIKNEVFSSGHDRAGKITTSIEPRAQALIESKTDDLVTKWQAKKVGIMVIDPKTGEIIAMASRPTFDPNNYRTVEDQVAFLNPFVEDVFEMGSIMKAITMASALDAGAITPETTYFDNGFVEFDGKRIGNYDGRGRGKISMQDVLDESLNTGSVFAEQSLGNNHFRDYMYRFGFQDKTGIDLPNETSNLISNLESGRDVEYATASFGQGIAVSPISMVRALSAVANGGFLIKPHVVKSINYNLGYSEETKVTEQGRVISGQTSEILTNMLIKVVDGYLAGGKVKMAHYSIAAKTGTAQIANPTGGGYYADRFLHSFFGYFPAYNPRFLVFLFLDEPVGARYASETLSAPFREIVQFLISYYDIPPDR